jgi:hypothetical protein
MTQQVWLQGHVFCTQANRVVGGEGGQGPSKGPSFAGVPACMQVSEQCGARAGRQRCQEGCAAEGGARTGVWLCTARSEADMGVLRLMDMRSSTLSALGSEPYMVGDRKLAAMLGRPSCSQRSRSSCGGHACSQSLSCCFVWRYRHRSFVLEYRHFTLYV